MEASVMASLSALISRPSLPFPKSMLNPNPNRIIFNATHPKPAFSVRILSGYFTSRAKTAINSSSKNLHQLTEEEMTESLYCLLGVSQAATASEIKKAYKRLVLKYHPDVSPAESAREFTRMFIRIQEAYETLSDPMTRSIYDFTRSAFSAQTLYHSHQQGMDKSGDWRWRWQVQLEELERNSRNKDSKDNRKSWAARVRMQRRESSII